MLTAAIANRTARTALASIAAHPTVTSMHTAFAVRGASHAHLPRQARLKLLETERMGLVPGTDSTPTPKPLRHLRGVMVMPVEDDRFGDPLLPVGTIIEAVDGIRVGTLDELYERMDRKLQRERRPSVLLEGVQPDGTGFQIEIPI